MTIRKHAKEFPEYKQASYSSLKPVLEAEGIHVDTPLYRAVDFSKANVILNSGFKAKVKNNPEQESYQNNAVCFSRNLSFLEGASLPDQGIMHGNGLVIFVLDKKELRNRFKVYPFFYRDDDSTKIPPWRTQIFDPSRDEYEERVSISGESVNDPNEPETVIPPEYIKAIFVLKSETDSAIKFITNHFGKKPIFIRSGLPGIGSTKVTYKHVKNVEDLLDFNDLLLGAIEKKDIKSAKEYLKKIKDINYNKGEFLRRAVLRRSPEIVKLLLEKGADPNANGGEPLISSVRDELIGILELLLKHNVDVNIRNGIIFKSYTFSKKMSKLLSPYMNKRLVAFIRKTAKEFPSGINKDPGINLNGPTTIYDTEETAYPELNDEEEVGQYKEYDPQKGRGYDIDFLSKDDDSYKELSTVDVFETPLDDFDGDLSIDQVSTQYPKIPPNRYKPLDLHSLDDNVDAYEEYEMNMMAKKAMFKTANIIPGDMILIMRPNRYTSKSSLGYRVARVISNLDNGWLVVKNLKGEKIAVYAGTTNEDDDVQKLDFDFLEQVYRNKISSLQGQKKKNLRNALINLISNFNRADYNRDMLDPAIDEGKEDDLMGYYSE